MTSPREPTLSEVQMKRLDSRLAQPLLPQPKPALVRHSAPGLSRIRRAEMSLRSSCSEAFMKRLLCEVIANGRHSVAEVRIIWTTHVPSRRISLVMSKPGCPCCVHCLASPCAAPR